MEVVLETQKIQRIGSNKDIKVDVRTVCATHKDLVLMTEKNEFRADLLFRLNVFPIDVPTLRERASDIPLLIKNFQITELRNLPKEKHPQFTQDAYRALSKYSWPGNIRELKNVVERSVYRALDDGKPVDVITLDPFDSIFRPTGSTDNINAASSKSTASKGHSFPLDFKQTVQDYEIDLIQKALSASQFNQKKTAETLGVTYHQLRGYMKKYELFEND